MQILWLLLKSMESETRGAQQHSSTLQQALSVVLEHAAESPVTHLCELSRTCGDTEP